MRLSSCYLTILFNGVFGNPLRRLTESILVLCTPTEAPLCGHTGVFPSFSHEQVPAPFYLCQRSDSTLERAKDPACLLAGAGGRTGHQLPVGLTENTQCEPNREETKRQIIM